MLKSCHIIKNGDIHRKKMNIFTFYALIKVSKSNISWP